MWRFVGARRRKREDKIIYFSLNIYRKPTYSLLVLHFNELIIIIIISSSSSSSIIVIITVIIIIILLL